MPNLRIELENLWRRLATRFKARTRVPPEERGEYPELLQTLQPITNFDEVARQPKVKVVSAYDPGSTGNKTLFIVPAGKRWHIRSCFAERETGATLTISRVVVLDFSEGNAESILEYFTAATEHSTLFDGQSIILDEYDTLQVFLAAYTAGDTLSGNCLIEEEDAF